MPYGLQKIEEDYQLESHKLKNDLVAGEIAFLRRCKLYDSDNSNSGGDCADNRELFKNQHGFTYFGRILDAEARRTQM